MNMSEEEEIKVKETAFKKALVQKQLIVFELRSEYFGSRTKCTGKKEVTTFGTTNVSKIRTLRKLFYNNLHKVAYKTLIGWVVYSQSDESVENFDRLNEIIREYNTIFGDHKVIRIITVYLPPGFLLEMVRENIEKLSTDYKKIQEKIAENIGSYQKVKRLIAMSSRIREEIGKLQEEMKYLKKSQ